MGGTLFTKDRFSIYLAPKQTVRGTTSVVFGVSIVSYKYAVILAAKP